MSVENKIQAAASQNSRLLAVLSETDYAPPALDQHKRYIADVENEMQELDKHIKSLEAKRAKELKEHEKYRDSTMKRFAYKLGGKTDKFQARASKEEREYFDALQQEHRAKETHKDLTHRLSEASTSLSNLESLTSTHRRAQTDLDALYDSIFEGPTPGFPAEDAHERHAAAALSHHHDLRTRTEAEGQALRILCDAQTKMQGALASMDEAAGYSRLDMFGGGTITDMMERSALGRAETLLAQCRTRVAQAQRMSAGGVRDLPPVDIAKGSLMSDVLFDNIFTDMAFHDRIKQSVGELRRAADVLAREIDAAGRRHGGLERELERVAGELEEARRALQKAREVAFEQVLGGRGGG